MRREDLTPAELPVFRIPCEAIYFAEDRLRFLKAEQARAIGAAIKADRQYDPITVTQLPGESQYLLVDGLHRLEGCRSAGIAEIEARIVGSDRASRLRQEALTCLVRASDDVFDKAAQIAALANLAREAAGLPSGDLRKLNGSRSISAICADAESDLDIVSKSLHWSEEVAQSIDLSPRSVRRYAIVAERFSHHYVQLLREIGAASEVGPLLALARLDDDAFVEAMMLLQFRQVATIADALAKLAAPKPPSATSEKASRSLIKKMADWEVVDRKRLIADLLAVYHIDGREKAKGR